MEDYWKVVNEWAPHPQKDPAWSCEFTGSTKWALAANVVDTANAAISKDDTLACVIEGEFGRRFEIEEYVYHL